MTDSELMPKKPRGRPPREHDGDIVTYTYRTDAETWRLFNMIAAMNGEAPIDIFSKFVKSYIKEHKDRLRTMLDEMENLK
jgi:hypothetical protein